MCVLLLLEEVPVRWVLDAEVAFFQGGCLVFLLCFLMGAYRRGKAASDLALRERDSLLVR